MEVLRIRNRCSKMYSFPIVTDQKLIFSSPPLLLAVDEWNACFHADCPDSIKKNFSKLFVRKLVCVMIIAAIT